MNGISAFSCVVHLLHAASGLTLSYVASPDTRVDVGTIAAHFALQPNSLRLNGHFISRDSHFISGLTWRPLLSFFHSRGLNSGTHALNPVEVQGIPLLQLPMEGIITSKLEDSFACHEKPQNAKRRAVQSYPISPFKRSKQESDSGIITSKVEDSFACHEKPQNAKRTAVQSNPISPFKRSKQESNSDGIRAMQLHKLKRGRFEDDGTSCMWNKRVRQEVYSGVQQGTDEFQLCKDDANIGSKRQESLDDISIERRLWKRMKEVKV